MQIKPNSKFPLELQELKTYLLNNFTVGDIAESLARYMLRTALTEPIVLDKEDYHKIMNIFRCRGVRIKNGVEVEETRGRSRKVTEEEGTE